MKPFYHKCHLHAKKPDLAEAKSARIKINRQTEKVAPISTPYTPDGRHTVNPLEPICHSRLSC